MLRRIFLFSLNALYNATPDDANLVGLTDSFRRLAPGMTTAEVESSLGPPHVVEDTTIPDGSVWGMQGGLRYKIREREPVLQWNYFDDDNDHCVWFAKPAREWLLTLRLSLPRGLGSTRI